MTAPAPQSGRKRPTRRSGGPGQWMLGVIIVLAVLGTGMWLFSDDKRWGVVALILLIWGLVIAAFLIARYLRDLRGAEAKEHDLKLIYDLQLEREIAARHEYELTVERDVRAEVRAESKDELRELKAEVLALRANLEELLGRDLGPSYAELFATAQRQALEENKRSVFDDDDRVNAQSDFAAMAGGSAPDAPEPPAAGEEIDDYYGSASQTPAEQYPPDQQPAARFGGYGQYPGEQYPADQYPAAPAPQERFAGSQFGGQYPAEQYPSEQYPGAPGGYPPAHPAAAAPSGSGATVPGDDDEAPTTVFPAVVEEPDRGPQTGPDSTLLLPAVEDGEPVDVEPVDVDQGAGHHANGGSTVAELIARMNAGTERTTGGGRRRRRED